MSKKADPPFWIGGLASMMAASMTHPLDLLKVRMQTETGNTKPTYGSTISKIVSQEGVRGMFRGLSASLLRQATYSTTRFAVYDGLKRELSARGKMNFWTQNLAAVMAGAIGGIVGNPADLVNIRMQNDSKLPPEMRRNYKNVFDGLLRVVKDEGPTSLLKGVGPTAGRAILITLGQLGGYDFFKQRLLKTGYFSDNLTTHFSASLLAGLVATTIASPVDVVKTRVMTQTTKMYNGMGDAFVKILRNEGPLAFFKGWLSSFTRLGPHTVLTFVFYEKLKQITTQ